MLNTDLDFYRRTLALLKAARTAQGLSEADLAARLQQTEAFVVKYEGGGYRLDPAEYVAIARAIGVDPYELLQRAEQGRG